MQSLSDDEREEVLGEVLHDELKAILEAVGDLQRQAAILPSMQADIADLKQDMKIVKAAVTDISREHRDFDRRLSQLESTQAHTTATCASSRRVQPRRATETESPRRRAAPGSGHALR